MKRKTFTMNEKHIDFLEIMSEQKQISQSEVLRRVIEFFEEKNKPMKRTVVPPPSRRRK